VRIILETSHAGFVEYPGGVSWGHAAPFTLLDGEPDGGTRAPSERCVIRAGFIPDDDYPQRPDPRTWGPRGWEALEASIRACLRRQGPRLLVRTAHTDVLSDAPSCIRFLDRREEWGGGSSGVDRLGILLDPAAMIAPSMIATAEDHIARILEIVAALPGVDGVVAANIKAHNGQAVATPFHMGMVPPDRLGALLRVHVPVGTPIVLKDEDLDNQIAKLSFQ
jgi:hypothetical protein